MPRFDQTRGQRADAIVEFAVTPFARGRVERRPDQEGMVAAHLSAHGEQPGHVEPGEGADDARRLRWMHLVLPRGLGFERPRFLVRPFLPPHTAPGKLSQNSPQR
jgi:hypothetical protein